MSHLLILGGTPGDRRRFARSRIPSTHTTFALDTATLPFVRVEDIVRPPAPLLLLLDEVERAFPDFQTGGTRLVLTQSTYLLQKWIDLLDKRDLIIATADRASLQRCAPEAVRGRGPSALFDVVDLDDAPRRINTEGTTDTAENGSFVSPVSFVSTQPATQRLVQAYAMRDAVKRVRFCREAISLDPGSAVAWLALASACREAGDDTGARDALERAAALAPDWEAVHYESGKLWLVKDDIARVRTAFQRAADLMPTFSAAYSNLGATLGELDEPDAALKAFRHALVHDPHSVTLLNNIGVVCRQLGRLDESEEALRRATASDPSFVFAHYNLGHTLFLAGRYPDALRAYEDGRRRDPEQNRRQGCRMAVVRMANGDAPAAERDLWQCVEGAPAGEREDLLLEAYEIAHAVLAQQPAGESQRAFLDRIARTIQDAPE